MRITKIFPLGMMAFILTLMPIPTKAGTLLPDRASLNSLLGNTAITEDFESFNTGFLPQISIFSPILNSSTIVPPQFGIPAQGPYLVVDGVTFDGFNVNLEIENQQSIIGRGSKVLDISRPFINAPLLIDFSGSVTAFGFNAFPLSFGRWDFNLTVFADDDTTVLENDIVTVFFEGSFIGISEPRGIGSVVINAVNPSNFFQGTAIDNLTFGGKSPEPSPIPEPSSVWGLLFLSALGTGSALLRKLVTDN